jgi:hypothetical protein
VTVAASFRTSATSIPEGEVARQLLLGEVIWDYDIPQYPFEVPDHSTSPDLSARSFHAVDNPILAQALCLARSTNREMLTYLFTLAIKDWILTPHHGSVARIPHLVESQTDSDYTTQFCTFVLATDHSSDPLPLSLSSSWPYSERTVDPLDGYEHYATPNWDGEDAEPITPQTLQYARRLLEVMPNRFGPPDIAPSADGSIGLEWVPDTGPLRKLFLDIGPGEEWRAYWTRRNGEFGRLTGKGFGHATQRVLQQFFDDLSK